MVIFFLWSDPSWRIERRIKNGTISIPSSLSLFLRDHFPNLEILSKEYALQEIIDFFESEKIKQPSPLACLGDFNGDKLQDFALLMRDKTKEISALVAFHKTRQQTYVHYVLEQGGEIKSGQKIGEYLICEKPGMKRDYEGVPFKVLMNNNITVGIWEKASILYYFENNQYKSVVTSD
jgi:hypothetical protein